MINKNSRDFISGYKLDNNRIIVSLGTGEKVVYPIEERNRIKLAIENEINELNNTKKEAEKKSKNKKYESYLNVAIVISSLTTLGSLNPSLIPLISLSSVAGANGVLYFINKNKAKKYQEIAKDERINNTIYELQVNQKDADSNDKKNTVSKTRREIININQQLENDNSYEEEIKRKVA